MTVVVLFVGSTLLAFLLALAAGPVVVALSHRLEILDVPGGRRIHLAPTPRAGGIAIAAAFGLTIL
ncbi:MAG: undecaprenyl/decaprenyl-phosphate alpha-N-acetylglucosaminyl 1-phosphate transferase, partial [Chloroflexi bacterium]|nr:undecaprenyl/decaprenyl-phosphate alpha-N-acetylglucosaminyl 1-phosphate transferase [Chloroflexota bacterium]